MGIGFRELLIILVIALILFGAKKLRNVGSDLGAAVRGFKKAVNEGDDEATKQLKDLTETEKDADFKERTDASKSDSKPAA
jgi:sec-independent protein translocase protein TatA